MRNKRAPSFPFAVIALDLAGVGLLVPGIMGLNAEPGGSLGVLTDPILAWSPAASGGMLLAIALFLLLQSVKGQR